MSAVSEASNLLKEIGAPGAGSVKDSINRAREKVNRFLPRRLWLSVGRVEDLWRREARMVRAEEMDAIRKAAADRSAAREARNELAELDARLSRLEALLVQDEEFVRPHADAVRALSRNPHRPVD